MRTREQTVISDAPQYSILRLILFSIHYMDSWIESTLKKFADNLKLSGVVEPLEGQDVIPWDPDRLLEWAHEAQQGQVQGPLPEPKQYSVSIRTGGSMG